MFSTFRAYRRLRVTHYLLLGILFLATFIYLKQPGGLDENAIHASMRSRYDFREKHQPTALVFTTVVGSKLQIEICDHLTYLRTRCEAKLPNWSLNELENDRLYDVIIFLNLQSYSNLNPTKRMMLKRYCNLHNVGVLVFHWRHELGEQDLIPVDGTYLKQVNSLRIEPNNTLWRITKDGGRTQEDPDSLQNPWVSFDLDGLSKEQFSPLTYASDEVYTDERNVVGFTDNGLTDGIRKVVLGNTLDVWLHHAIFLDALHHLSNGVISMPLKRAVLLEIDDIFLGSASDQKMNVSDVKVRNNDINILNVCQNNVEWSFAINVVSIIMANMAQAVHHIVIRI